MSQIGEIETFGFCVEKVEPLHESGGDIAAGCLPESYEIIPDENNWVDECSNILGIQGDWYRYSDGG